MSESLSVIMKVICLTLTVCFSFMANGKNTSNYSYDTQILGFNSTNITSGPLVLADKRTLFISNLQYKGDKDILKFYAGVGSTCSDQIQLVAEEYFLANHSNVFISLPENFTLDVIGFLGVAVNDLLKPLDCVIFKKINRTTIREYQGDTMEHPIYRIPKCCQHYEYLTTAANGCVESKEEIELNINIFESNETGLDPNVTLNVSDYDLRPYVQDLKCNDNEYRVEVGSTRHGLIYNSSLIVEGSGILSHGEFCIEVTEDNGNFTTNALYCYPKPSETSDPNLYLPMLIISTICFAVSAAAYGIILRAKDIHKMCFIAFSLSMCLTFLSLIVLQVQNNYTTCSIFGFVFIFATVFSFLWLFISCLELLYLVRYPLEDKRFDHRWYWYLAASFGVSLIICLISLFSGELWTPDVPKSFIKNYGNNKCEFETATGRTFIVFVPMILSIVMSVGSLEILRYFLNKNEEIKEIKSHVDWVVNKNTYTFLYRTYIIIIGVSSFWLLNMVLYAFQVESAKTQLALDIIEAALGVVTLIGFVLNKYTLAEIKEKMFMKKKITEEGLRLNGIPTPETPSTDLDPFVQPLNRNPNLTTFTSNR